jgi:cellulose synthase (UDP-forming)
MKTYYFQRIKKLRWYFLLLVISGVVAFVYHIQPAQALLGVYDPSQTFHSKGVQADSAAVTLEHHFVTWRPDNAQELAAALQQAQQHQRMAMISLESWPWNWQGMVRSTLLQDIASGRYDETLDRCLRTIQAISPQTVLLRWGHEMEIVGQYPWSVENPQAYIAAYRHWVSRARQLGIGNIIWVWSPAGNESAINYWPGDDVVDIVGISIYATPAWHPDRLAELPSFSRLMQQKSKLWQHWRKPVLIAEVGVTGSAAEKQQWLTQAIQDLKNFPQVIGWVYFNQIQPEIVPLPIGRPDWSLDLPQAEYLMRSWQSFQPGRSDQARLESLLARSVGK